MTASIDTALPLFDLSHYVGSNLGLHFPVGRHKELLRGLQAAAPDYGFDDAIACARWLVAQPPSLERLLVLARHLTIGETYFFRDQQALEVLATEVLAPLVQQRQAGARFLRLWSAGCSTGEEAYTLAILLHRLIPDIARWNIVVMATDINVQSLDKARAATYGEWSFRSAPPWLKRGYFERDSAGRYTVKQTVRNLVRFELMNLADTPSHAGGVDLRNMDVILCRHVLMYFDIPRAARAAAHLHACLASGGWLVTSACEASPQVFAGFEAVTHSGAVLMRRREGSAAQGAPELVWNVPVGSVSAELGAMGSGVEPAVAWFAPRPQPATSLTSAFAFDAFMPASEPAATPPPVPTPAPVPDVPERHAEVPTAAVRARALAGSGRLDEALQVCEDGLRAHKLDAVLQYVRAAVLLERGDVEGAEAGLQKALYVDDDFVLAHFTRGQLALQRGARGLAQRHLARARELLQRQPPDAPVAESEGMSAGGLLRALQPLLARAGAVA